MSPARLRYAIKAIPAPSRGAEKDVTGDVRSRAEGGELAAANSTDVRKGASGTEAAQKASVRVRGRTGRTRTRTRAGRGKLADGNVRQRETSAAKLALGRRCGLSEWYGVQAERRFRVRWTTTMSSAAYFACACAPKYLRVYARPTCIHSHKLARIHEDECRSLNSKNQCEGTCARSCAQDCAHSRIGTRASFLEHFYARNRALCARVHHAGCSCLGVRACECACGRVGVGGSARLEDRRELRPDVLEAEAERRGETAARGAEASAFEKGHTQRREALGVRDRDTRGCKALKAKRRRLAKQTQRRATRHAPRQEPQSNYSHATTR
eukprot:2927742-Pleurochrysis_carterae.AAC.3